MKLNNRGFTLVELLATIVIFAIVAGIGAFSVTAIIKNSKNKNYELLVKNIKDAAEVYYQECKYAKNSGITCSYEAAKNGYRITYADLIKYGYLEGNVKNNETGEYSIEDPRTNGSLTHCIVLVKYDEEKDKVLVKRYYSFNRDCPVLDGDL